MLSLKMLMLQVEVVDIPGVLDGPAVANILCLKLIVLRLSPWFLCLRTLPPPNQPTNTTNATTTVCFDVWGAADKQI